MGATSAFAATAVLLLVGAAAAAAAAAATRPRTTPAPADFSSVWDAYPASLLPMCPHIPRRPIDFQQLNGRWYVMEKGGHWQEPETLCDVDFQILPSANLTLRVGLGTYSEGNLVKRYNTTWKMTADNVWRDNEFFMFLGHSTNRAVLVSCAVDSLGSSPDGYSLALSRDPRVRQSQLILSRIRGYAVEAIDRDHCPYDG